MENLSTMTSYDKYPMKATKEASEVLTKEIPKEETIKLPNEEVLQKEPSKTLKEVA